MAIRHQPVGAKLWLWLQPRAVLRPVFPQLAKVADGAVKAAGVKFAIGEDANFRKTFGNPPELKKKMAA